MGYTLKITKNMIAKVKSFKRFPELIVILVCVAIWGIGISNKEGYHLDEILSYEMSNAAYNPWIVPTQPQGRLAKFMEKEVQGESFGETMRNLLSEVGDVLQNRGSSKLLSYQADVYEEPVWITAEDFSKYITVDDNDAFHYFSVYFNVKDDTHPILYYLLLHTASSVLRGSAEPIVGCIVNVVAIVGVLALLMRLGHFFAAALGMEERARAVGIFAAVCYGISTGAMATVLLNRMYALLTFFCVALLVVHVEKWSEKKFNQRNKCLIVVTTLGFLSQYFFLFYCLILAALTAVGLLREKRMRELFCYVRAMVIAAVLGVGIFPFSIQHVLMGDRGVEAFESLSNGLDGFGSKLASFAKILAERTFGLNPVTVCISLIMLGGALFFIIRNIRKNNRSDKSKFVMWMLTIPAAGYFLLASRMSPYLVDRYIMAIFPFVILGVVLLMIWLADQTELIRGKKGQFLVAFCGCMLLCQIWNLAHYDGAYLYKGYNIQKTVADEYAEYPCICVYTGVGYYENVLEFTEYAATLLVTEDELANRQETTSIEKLDNLVLLLKPNVDADYVFKVMEEKYGFVLDSYLIKENSVHGDTIVLMNKK